MTSQISYDELRGLFDTIFSYNYKAKEGDFKIDEIGLRCLHLFGSDYKFMVIPNTTGELCNHYPTRLVILEYATQNGGRGFNGSVESMYDKFQMQDLFVKARLARCRSRFPVPVILYEGKHICRSATLSGGPELYSRTGFHYVMTGGGSAVPADDEPQSLDVIGDLPLLNRVRNSDIKLLKLFNVTHIFDLMLEKKKVKFNIKVSSSEKVDKEKRYSGFHIFSLPYPGCEFFRDWRDNAYQAEGLCFDWSQSFVNIQLELPIMPPPLPHIDWTLYEHWDLLTITQNYMELIIHYVSTSSGGMLLHCISGWDRTPLFISLLRLSLWADGAIHTSLGAHEILYLTVAYDWFLFGHNFSNRMAKGEEIFFFCFHFLDCLKSSRFSVKPSNNTSQSSPLRRDVSDMSLNGMLFAENDTKSFPTRRRSSSIKNANNGEAAHRSFYVDDDDLIVLSQESGARYSHNNASAQTSAIAVPVNTRRVQQQDSGDVAGSWQMVSRSACNRGGSFSNGPLPSNPSDASFSSFVNASSPDFVSCMYSPPQSQQDYRLVCVCDVTPCSCGAESSGASALKIPPPSSWQNCDMDVRKNSSFEEVAFKAFTSSHSTVIDCSTPRRGDSFPSRDSTPTSERGFMSTANNNGSTASFNTINEPLPMSARSSTPCYTSAVSATLPVDRKSRLEEVQKLFFGLYTEAMTSRESEQYKLTGFFSTFAQKVGLRSGKS